MESQTASVPVQSHASALKGSVALGVANFYSGRKRAVSVMASMKRGGGRMRNSLIMIIDDLKMIAETNEEEFKDQGSRFRAVAYLLLVMFPISGVGRIVGFSWASEQVEGGCPPAFAQALAKATGAAIMATVVVAVHGFGALRESMSKQYLVICFASICSALCGFLLFLSLRYISSTTSNVSQLFAILFLLPLNAALNRVLPTP